MTLATVTRAAAKVRAAELALQDAIREARTDGASLRDIAKAADISHEQVRRITQGRPLIEVIP